jgi:hypothetical protein
MTHICTVKTAIEPPCLAFMEGVTEPSEPNSPKPLVVPTLNPDNFIGCMFKISLSFSAPPQCPAAFHFPLCFFASCE